MLYLRAMRRLRELYTNLPHHVQLQARRAYQLSRRNPFHPSLNFKKVDEVGNIYSARVGLGCRVLGQWDGGDII